MAQQQQSQTKHAQQSQVQMPSAADISLLLSLGMGGLDASQLANLDLQKLAMYLVSIFNLNYAMAAKKCYENITLECFTFVFKRTKFEDSYKNQLALLKAIFR